MGHLTLVEFLNQLRQLREMGGIRQVFKLLPRQLREIGEEIDERELVSAEKILSAMTPEELRDSDLLIEEGRRRRVAEKAGRSLEEVNSLIAQFYLARRFGSDYDEAPN